MASSLCELRCVSIIPRSSLLSLSLSRCSSSFHPSSSFSSSSSSSSFSSSSSSSSSLSSSPSSSLSSLSLCRRHFSSSSLTSSSSSVIRTSFELREALRLTRAVTPPREFDDTFKIAFNLGVDPRKPNQNVRGVVSLPHGTGKKVRVAVFAKGGKVEEAKLAGADIVGEMDLVDKILKGNIDFDRCIATPDMMGIVGRVARVLGPRGLMPNPKVGTITNDLATAIKNAKAGQLQFKTDKAGLVHVAIGKMSFTDDQIYDNLSALVDHLNKIRPPGTKGTFIRKVTISTTHSVGVPIDVTQPPFRARMSTVGSNTPSATPKKEGA